jgi:hypothetical protein
MFRASDPRRTADWNHPFTIGRPVAGDQRDQRIHAVDLAPPDSPLITHAATTGEP